MSAAEDRGDLPYEPVETLSDPAGTVQHPVLRQLHAYWTGKRGRRMAPSREEIDPVEFRYAIGWVSLIDVRAGVENFEMRVFGGHTARIMEHEPTFRTAADSNDPEFHSAAMRDLRWVVEHRRPLRVFRDLQTAKRRYRFEGLVLPLSDDGETVNFLLAAAIPPVGG